MLRKYVSLRLSRNAYMSTSTSNSDPTGSPGTYVLRRKYEPMPLKSTVEGFLPKRHRDSTIVQTYQIYEKVQGPGTVAPPTLSVLLVQYVEGLGVPGDEVSLKLRQVSKLLLSGQAVYASPYNLAKYAHLQEPMAGRQARHSSLFAGTTAKYLSKLVLSVTMNLETPWTIEPWHVRACFRKAGVVVPEHCIEMPEQSISGPDVDRLNNRVFLVTVTINKTESVVVRCRIHHMATSSLDRLPYTRYHWAKPCIPVFPEDAERIASLPPVASPREEDEDVD